MGEVEGRLARPSSPSPVGAEKGATAVDYTSNLEQDYVPDDPQCLYGTGPNRCDEDATDRSPYCVQHEEDVYGAPSDYYPELTDDDLRLDLFGE